MPFKVKNYIIMCILRLTLLYGTLVICQNLAIISDQTNKIGHVCMRVCMCTHVCTCTCMYVCVHVCMHTHVWLVHLCLHAQVCICEIVRI